MRMSLSAATTKPILQCEISIALLESPRRKRNARFGVVRLSAEDVERLGATVMPLFEER